MNISKLTLWCLFLIGFIHPAYSQFNWELKKKQDDLSIYTSVVKGSEFKAFKAVLEVPATSISEITAILIDVEQYVNFFPDARNAHIIKNYNEGHFIHYLETDLPWPVDDRAGVYEVKSSYNQPKNEVIILVNIIKYDIPESTDALMMTKGAGEWKVAPLKNGKYEVTFQFHAEPSGSVPAWLANSFVVDHPYKTMQNLKKILNSGKYKNAKVDFIN